MSKYFTKAYIKECDCGEIQNMKNNLERDGKNMLQFNEGDWWQNRNNKEIHVAYQITWENRQFYIWLPTGDQLDEEIIRITNKKYQQYLYSTNYDNSSKEYTVYVDVENPQVIEENPLIAKTKLLKQLIKGG